MKYLLFTSKRTLLPLIFIAFFLCSTDTPKNTAPKIGEQSFTVSENALAKTNLGTIKATDAETAQLKYAITKNSSDLFIVTTTGELQLLLGKKLDYESATNHTISVEVSDGDLATSNEITISVTNIIDEIYVTGYKHNGKRNVTFYWRNGYILEEW